MRLRELISVLTGKEQNQRQAGSSEPACCETLHSHEPLAAVEMRNTQCPRDFHCCCAERQSKTERGASLQVWGQVIFFLGFRILCVKPARVFLSWEYTEHLPSPWGIEALWVCIFSWHRWSREHRFGGFDVCQCCTSWMSSPAWDAAGKDDPQWLE